jgi:hypothetical protein
MILGEEYRAYRFVISPVILSSLVQQVKMRGSESLEVTPSAGFYYVRVTW